MTYFAWLVTGGGSSTAKLEFESASSSEIIFYENNTCSSSKSIREIPEGYQIVGFYGYHDSALLYIGFIVMKQWIQERNTPLTQKIRHELYEYCKWNFTIW